MPIGEGRDHPLANPFGPNSLNLQSVDLDPLLVIVGSNELMKDRILDYASRLKEMGKAIDYVEFEGQQHGFFTNHPYSPPSDRLLQIINDFISHNSSLHLN